MGIEDFIIGIQIREAKSEEMRKNIRTVKQMTKERLPKYRPELLDKEKLASAQLLLHKRYYERKSMEMAEKAKLFNIPCFVPAIDGNTEFGRDVKSLNKKLPIYIKARYHC